MKFIFILLAIISVFFPWMASEVGTYSISVMGLDYRLFGLLTLGFSFIALILEFIPKVKKYGIFAMLAGFIVLIIAFLFPYMEEMDVLIKPQWGIFAASVAVMLAMIFQYRSYNVINKSQ